MLPRSMVFTLGFAMLGAGTMGCAARGHATVATGISADATYVAEPAYSSGAQVIIEEPGPQVVVFRDPPPLVVVEPDVYVVEDASYAIYFVGGFYWHVGSGGRWYRSSRWDQPWVHVDVHLVPPRISRRNHHAYVHFRASASARVFRQPRERGGNDRALRVVERRDERRHDRRERVERRLDPRKPTPAAGPRRDRDVRRSKEDARPDAGERRSAPSGDRDLERRRLEPPRRDVERPDPKPRAGAERERHKPRVDDARPRPVPDRARPDEKKKKARKKKADEKRKPKDPGRRRPSRSDR